MGPLSSTYAVAVVATPLVSPLPVLLLLLDAWPLGRLDVSGARRRIGGSRGVSPRSCRSPSSRSRSIARTVGSIAHTIGSSPDVVAGVCGERVRGRRALPRHADPADRIDADPSRDAAAAGGRRARCSGSPRRPPPSSRLGRAPRRSRSAGSGFSWPWCRSWLCRSAIASPHLPSLGLLIALAAVTGSRRHRQRRDGVAAVAIAVCVVLTSRELGHWRDEETVLRHALAVSDGQFHGRARTRRVARLRAARGTRRRSTPAKSVRLPSRRPRGAGTSLGEVRLHEGHVDAAAEHFAAAFAARPDLQRVRLQPRARGAAARAASTRRSPRTKRSSKARPTTPATHAGLARALRQRGELDEARAHFERAPRARRAARRGAGAARPDARRGRRPRRRRRTLPCAPRPHTGRRLRSSSPRYDRGPPGRPRARRGGVSRRAPAPPRPRRGSSSTSASCSRPAARSTRRSPPTTRALRAAPRLASAQYNRALALAARDDPAGAEAALRAELEVQPNWPPALIRLAALLAADGATGRVEAARLADQAAASLGRRRPRRRSGAPSRVTSGRTRRFALTYAPHSIVSPKSRGGPHRPRRKP